jgi:hypothetical protein
MPNCGRPVPEQLKWAGEAKRFCSDACRVSWHRACRRIGELVLLKLKGNSVSVCLSAEDPEIRPLLPPARCSF